MPHTDDKPSVRIVIPPDYPKLTSPAATEAGDAQVDSPPSAGDCFLAEMPLRAPAQSTDLPAIAQIRAAAIGGTPVREVYRRDRNASARSAARRAAGAAALLAGEVAVEYAMELLFCLLLGALAALLHLA